MNYNLERSINTMKITKFNPLKLTTLQKIQGLVLLATAFQMTAANAASLSIPFLCTIQQYISGPYLFVVGVVAIIVGSMGMAMGKDEITKIITGCLVPLGIAAAAPQILGAMGVTIGSGC
jgi:type IV secretory pathway VirB2 component (pilin)